MKTPKWRLIVLLVFLLLGLGGRPVSANGGNTRAIIGKDFVLQQDERLEDDLLVLGGLVRLMEGSVVEGSVVAVGGETMIAGSVRGDVVTIGGSTEMAATALIGGDLVAFGQVRRHPGATVRGNTIEGLEAAQRFTYAPKMWNGRLRLVPTLPEPIRPQVKPSDSSARPKEPAFPLLARVGTSTIAILLLAALVVALVPQRLTCTIDAMHHAWLLCSGMGVLTMVVVLILMPVLIITCLGIPVAIVLGIGLLLSALMGFTAAGNLVGERLLRAARAQSRPPLISTLVGTLVIALIATIPCLGPALAAIVAAWGIGGIVLTRFGSLPYETWVPTTEAPSPPALANSAAGEPPLAASGHDQHPRDTKRLDQSALSENASHTPSTPDR